MDSQVTVAIVAGIFGIASVYGAQILRNRYGSARKPSSMEMVISGYERLVKSQQDEIDRKQKYIDQLQKLIDRLQEELSTSKQRLEDFQLQLTKLKSTYENSNKDGV